jgi:hypothetical protein
MGMQGTRRSYNLKTKSKVGEFTLFLLKLTKITAIKTMWHCPKDKLTEHWSGIDGQSRQTH